MPIDTTKEYLRIRVVPTIRRYKTYRTHDIGRAGHTKRIAGQRYTGKWETVTYLIPKKDIKKLDAKTYNTLSTIIRKYLPRKDRPALSRALRKLM